MSEFPLCASALTSCELRRRLGTSCSASTCARSVKTCANHSNRQNDFASLRGSLLATCVTQNSSPRFHFNDILGRIIIGIDGVESIRARKNTAERAKRKHCFLKKVARNENLKSKISATESTEQCKAQRAASVLSRHSQFQAHAHEQ